MARKGKKRGVEVRTEEQAVAQEAAQEPVTQVETMTETVAVGDVAQVIAEPQVELIEGKTVAAAVAITKEALIERRTAKGRRPWSAEARQMLSIRLQQHYQDHPEERVALREKIKAGWTQEKKLAHAEKMKAVLNDPAVKARMKEGMKRFWDEFKATRAEMNRTE